MILIKLILDIYLFQIYLNMSGDSDNELISVSSRTERLDYWISNLGIGILEN